MQCQVRLPTFKTAGYRGWLQALGTRGRGSAQPPCGPPGPSSASAGHQVSDDQVALQGISRPPGAERTGKRRCMSRKSEPASTPRAFDRTGSTDGLDGYSRLVAERTIGPRDKRVIDVREPSMPTQSVNSCVWRPRRCRGSAAQEMRASAAIPRSARPLVGRLGAAETVATDGCCDPEVGRIGGSARVAALTIATRPLLSGRKDARCAGCQGIRRTGVMRCHQADVSESTRGWSSNAPGWPVRPTSR